MVSLGAKDIQSEDDISGGNRPLPGRYHLNVKEVDETMDKFDKVIVEFEVLAGTTPGQEGRTFQEYFALTEKAIPRLQRLAIVLGLIKPGDPETDVSFSVGIGRQLVGEVEENDYEKDGQKKKGVRLGYLNYWSIGNKAVDDVPLNRDALQFDTRGTAAPSQPAAPAAAPAPAPTAPAPAPAPAPAQSSWDDL